MLEKLITIKELLAVNEADAAKTLLDQAIEEAMQAPMADEEREKMKARIEAAQALVPDSKIEGGK